MSHYVQSQIFVPKSVHFMEMIFGQKLNFCNIVLIPSYGLQWETIETFNWSHRVQESG